MSEENMRDYTKGRATTLIDHFDSSQNEYKAIWDLYERQMPQCIQNCKKKKGEYSQDTWLDGPQGIYWVGAAPQILFVGREHFGWYGETNWEGNKESICFAPLEFSFYTIASMGTYWAVIKELIQDVLKSDLGDWDDILKKVAFTNACKCLTNNRTLQWHLHQECARQLFLLHEIQTVSAPLNVLFTRSIDLSQSLFIDKTDIIEKSDDFVVHKFNDQIIIECAHPGRQSHEWRGQLKQVMSKYLTQAEPGV